MGGAFVIGIIFMLISVFVSNRLKSKFKKYSKLHLANNMSGHEIAEAMLADHNIRDVQVVSVPGQLTDHYNPATKTVNLSEGVYHQRNASAAAVAAHECGHAIQHATAYSMLQFRSFLVPFQNVSGRVINIVVMLSIFGGSFLFQAFPYDLVLLVIIGCYSIITLFSLVTLPVEYDASNRALQWIKDKHIVTDREYAASADALKWAARTYLVAALGSLATLMYYIMLLAGRRD